MGTAPCCGCFVSPCRRPVPLTVNANMLRYKGDLMTTLATSVQVRGGGAFGSSVRRGMALLSLGGRSLGVLGVSR